MKALEGLLTELAGLKDVKAVAAADDTGMYLSGINIEDADEFAAILAFIGRSGETIEDLLGLEQLNFISLSGKKTKLIVHKVGDNYIGIRLNDSAVVSKLELSINDVVKRTNIGED